MSSPRSRRSLVWPRGFDRKGVSPASAMDLARELRRHTAIRPVTGPGSASRTGSVVQQRTGPDRETITGQGDEADRLLDLEDRRRVPASSARCDRACRGRRLASFPGRHPFAVASGSGHVPLPGPDGIGQDRLAKAVAAEYFGRCVGYGPPGHVRIPAGVEPRPPHRRAGRPAAS